MKWSQVDFDRKLVDLRGDGGAANKRRAVVPMTDNLYERLCEAKSVALTDHVIEFKGSPIKRIDIAFRRRVERVPQLADVTPHVLRHTAAVWMAERCADVADFAVPWPYKHQDHRVCLCEVQP